MRIDTLWRRRQPLVVGWVAVMLVSCAASLHAQDVCQQTNGPYAGYVLALAITAGGDVFAGTYGGGVFRSMPTVTAVEDEHRTKTTEHATAFRSAQNFPNPFNPETTITYDLPEIAHIRLAIYSLSGQEIRRLVHTYDHSPGHYTVVWDGRDDAGRAVATGIYLYRLEAIDRGFVETKRMLLLRCAWTR